MQASIYYCASCVEQPQLIYTVTGYHEPHSSNPLQKFKATTQQSPANHKPLSSNLLQILLHHSMCVMTNENHNTSSMQFELCKLCGTTTTHIHSHWKTTFHCKILSCMVCMCITINESHNTSSMDQTT